MTMAIKASALRNCGAKEFFFIIRIRAKQNETMMKVVMEPESVMLQESPPVM